jgi:hypothetical protein
MFGAIVSSKSFRNAHAFPLWGMTKSMLQLMKSGKQDRELTITLMRSKQEKQPSMTSSPMQTLCATLKFVRLHVLLSFSY